MGRERGEAAGGAGGDDDLADVEIAAGAQRDGTSISTNSVSANPGGKSGEPTRSSTTRGPAPSSAGARHCALDADEGVRLAVAPPHVELDAERREGGDRLGTELGRPLVAHGPEDDRAAG